MSGKISPQFPRNVLIRSHLLVAFGVLMASVVLLALPAGSAAQPKAGVQAAPTLEVTVAVRSVAGGRIEFGIRDSKGALTSPANRYLSPNQIVARNDRWLNSTVVTVHGVELRVAARSRQNGKIEFAIRDDADRLKRPTKRYINQSRITARDDRWLQSSPVEIAVPAAAAKTVLLRALYRDNFGRMSGNDWGCPFTGPDYGGTYECRATSLYGDQYVDPAPPSWTAYEGGHSGIDTAHSRNRNAPFHSLTNGQVVHAGTNWRCRDIAVFDGTNTIVYLHASRIDVRVGDRVIADQTRLGLQGEKCSEGLRAGNQHVHIEVIPGKVQVRYGETGRVYARGAGLKAGSLKPCDQISVDPLPYLYWWLTDGKGTPPKVETAACQASSTTSTDDQSTPTLAPVDPESPSAPENSPQPVDGEQIVRLGSSEVYVVKIIGDGRYKRLFLSAEIRDTYGHLAGVEPTRISQEEFYSFVTSCLVKFGSDYYFLDVREGEDSATKHLIADGRQGLDAAGASAAAIFEVHALEINNTAFVRGGDISASDARWKTCGGS